MTDTERPASMIALFRRAAERMVSDLVLRMGAAGYPDISGTHHPVFENIDLMGTRLTVLAARAHLTHQSMSELVRTLEGRGYVERLPDPSDGRARLVRLTPRGLRMVRQAAREIDLIERRWASYWEGVGLGDHMRVALTEALDRHEAESGDRRSPRR